MTKTNFFLSESLDKRSCVVILDFWMIIFDLVTRATHLQRLWNCRAYAFVNRRWDQEISILVLETFVISKSLPFRKSLFIRIETTEFEYLSWFSGLVRFLTTQKSCYNIHRAAKLTHVWRWIKKNSLSNPTFLKRRVVIKMRFRIFLLT